MVLAAFTAQFLGETAGKFSFGCWLLARWYVSGFLSFAYVGRKLGRDAELARGAKVECGTSAETAANVDANKNRPPVPIRTNFFPNAKVLFVDGEGALRRRPDGDSPEGVNALQKALRRPALADVIVVACGQWKEVLNIADLRRVFEPDIAARVVDRTPDLEDDGTGFKTHREIHAWLEAHPEIANYSFLGPFYGLPPHVENGVFIHDGTVFGEHARHASNLETVFAH